MFIFVILVINIFILFCYLVCGKGKEGKIDLYVDRGSRSWKGMIWVRYWVGGVGKVL